MLTPMTEEGLSAHAAAGGPTIPVPSSFLDLPPVDGPRAVISTSPTKFMLWWDFDHADTQLWIPPPPPGQQPIPGTRGGINYYYGPPIPDYTLTHRQYWHMLDHQLIGAGASPPGGYTRHEVVTEGMSSTETTTLSGELGVDVKGLQAKLSKTLDSSITISTETTVEKTWIANGSETQDTVWILWQLVDEIVGLKPDGTIVGGWPYGTCGANINIYPDLFPDWNGDTSIKTPQALNFSDQRYAQIATRFDPT